MVSSGNRCGVLALANARIAAGYGVIEKVKHMKKSLNICFLMIFSIFQIACGHSYGLRVKGTSFFTNAEDPRIDLLLLTQYSLPGMDEAGARSSHIFIERDTNGREIIQQDNYGRECCLFEFKVPNQCYGGVPVEAIMSIALWWFYKPIKTIKYTFMRTIAFGLFLLMD